MEVLTILVAIASLTATAVLGIRQMSMQKHNIVDDREYQRCEARHTKIDNLEDELALCNKNVAICNKDIGALQEQKSDSVIVAAVLTEMKNYSEKFTVLFTKFDDVLDELKVSNSNAIKLEMITVQFGKFENKINDIATEQIILKGKLSTIRGLGDD